MGGVQSPQPATLAQHTLKQRVVVKHIHRSRILPKTLLQIRHRPPQPRLRKRVEQIEHGWLVRKSELSRIRADRFQREALLRFASVLTEVLLSRLMQRGQEFHAHDAAKRIIRSHQQRASFSRAEVDEDEVVKVRTTFFS